MKKLYMTIGLSNSGKSEYLKKQFNPKVIINPDSIRQELFPGKREATQDAVVWMTATKRLNEAMDIYGEAVLDSPNVNATYRKGVMAPFKKDKNIELIALVFPITEGKEIKKSMTDSDKVVKKSDTSEKILEQQQKDYVKGYSAIKYQFDKVKIIKESELKLGNLLREFKIQ